MFSSQQFFLDIERRENALEWKISIIESVFKATEQNVTIAEA